jgi:hemerythrin
MSVVAWDSALHLGFADIDDQHHRLIDLINEFDDAVRADPAGTVPASVIHDLLHYAIHHFSFEETLMDTHQLSSSEAHKQEHRQLLTQMRTIQADIDAGAAHAGELLVPLRTWLTEHLQHADAVLVEQLKTKGAKSLL